MKKFIRILMRVILFGSALIYPGMMAMLSAAGWRYQVQEGNYPEIFGVYSFWLFLGAGLILLGVVCSVPGMWEKFYYCNLIAVLTAVPGCISCMTVLSKFTAYADQNFSGIGEEMKPVSELYRDRLLPILLPVILLVILSAWQFLDSREYRIRKKLEKMDRENAEAPKILDD